tara:strand:- start:1149 stop:2372 length:1224 start_codon:yes stop_codon:yes gene_type:complete
MTEAVVENNSGSDTQTTQEGAKKDETGIEVGKLLTTTGKSKEHLQYPLKRSGKEDSLLIRCVKYKPPTKNGPIVSRAYGDLVSNNEDLTLGEGQEVPKFGGGFFKAGDTIKAGTQVYNGKRSKPTGSVFHQENFNAYAEGADRRYNQHQSGYNGDTYNTDTQFYVELPIPKQIGDNKSVDWGENSLNMFQMTAFNMAAGGNAPEEIQAVINTLQAGKMDIGEEGSGVEGMQDIASAIRAAVGGMAVNVFGGNTTTNQFMSRASGKVLNANKELLFNGSKLREFAFDFTFTPRSKDEADRALKIIRKLKQHMSPRAGDEVTKTGSEGLFINSPDLFLLRYLSAGEDHPFLNSFKPCALTSLSVNYSAGGVYASYGDSTPVHMKVNMIFKETNPVYFEDYTEDVKGVGF